MILSSSLSPYLPYIILSLVLVAMLLMGLVIYLTSTSLKKPQSASAPSTSGEPHRIPPYGKWFSHFLAQRGFLKVGDISLVFLRGLEFLRSHLDTVHYKYHLPWYLLIGPTRSGKSSLMERAGLTLPVGKPDFKAKEANPGLKWWFLNKGVILDIRGDFLLNDKHIQATEGGWKALTSLLARYRSKRPIDGIILTLPATEFYGLHKLSLEEIQDRAKYLSQKLATTQLFLGLKLPVYVVITKTDTIPGFQSFCRSIPHEHKGSMIGWSSPYHPSIAFNQEWIREAFQDIHLQLNHLRAEILSATPRPTDRDGVFLFPGEIMEIENPLGRYLAHIFRVSSYDEPLVLRGIYFTGDSGENLDPNQLFAMENTQKEKTTSLSIGELDNDPHLHGNLKEIFFFHDVLNEKIFRESGLATPIHQRLVSMNRHMLSAKIGMTAFLTFGTYGLFSNYERFKENNHHLLPLLGRIQTILSEIPTSRLDPTTLSTQMLDDQARQLLEMMSNINRLSYHSFFFPVSWFSPVDKSLKATLKVSFDQIILRTIYMDLLLKSRDLLSLKLEHLQKQEDDNTFDQLLNPVQTLEFNLLKGYVQRFIDLSRNINLFNRLGESNDVAILRDLIAYTKGMELPLEFMENYGQFKKLLNTIDFAKIDLLPYQKKAREILRLLYINFIDHLLSPNYPKSIVGKINYLLNEYGRQHYKDSPNPEMLRKIRTALNKAIPGLGVPGKTWMDNDYFDAGPAFQELLNEITQFPLFGPEMVHYFAAVTNDSLQHFQEKLAQLNGILVPRKPGEEARPPYPSEGIFRIQKVLDRLFSERFMSPSSNEMFITDIPKTHVVYWNSQLIDMATEDVKAYESYLSKNLKEIPIGIQGTIREMARQNLVSHIVSTLAQAQTIVPRPKSPSNLVMAEETLRDKIENVKSITPKFIKLLEVMNESGVGTSYVSLRNLLGTLSTRLLEQVDEILEGYGLYIVKEGNFSWWDGLSSPMLEGFNVKDPGDLVSYFDKQRTILSRLSSRYAEPMVTFLTSSVMQEYQGRDDLVSKWQSIAAELESYEKKVPNNNIFRIEETIQKDLVDLDLKKCFLEIPFDQVKASSPNYFAKRRIELRRSLLSRCEILRRQKSIENYKQLKDFFNEHLKDKFPFSHAVNADTPEAEPQDIREFFRLYKSMGDSPRVIYDQVYQLGSEAEDTFGFLQTMEKVKIFFEEFLKSPLAGEVPTFLFEADSRVNREAEQGANLINRWILKPDSTTELLKNVPIQEGKWSYGNEIELYLVWPAQSRVQPFRDKTQPNMEVNQNTVRFSYGGKWSFFRMLLQQQAPRSDYNMINEPTPYILKYQIPNGPESKTITFMRITPLKPAKGNGQPTPIKVPEFPVVAPEIPEAVMARSQTAVFAAGKMSPQEQGDLPLIGEETRTMTEEEFNKAQQDESPNQ